MLALAMQATATASGPLAWTVADLLAATGGRLVCGDQAQTLEGVSIDSRRVAAGQLFIAIRGQVHDGHRFLPEAIAGGARGLLLAVSKIQSLDLDRLARERIAVIAVPDTIQALGALAGFNRQRTGVSVVAVTGSNGKTSTKEMTAAVVSQRFRTLSTSGNLNNEIGMPLTLLNLESTHQWAVLELGMNHPGEIRRLAEICRPDIGIITNISRAHLEGLGSLDGVMRAKGELLEKMNPAGTAVLNADDPKVLELAQRTALPKTFFGLSDKADIRARSISSAAGTVRFRLVMPAEEIEISLAATGRFMVYNALAAAAVGASLQLSVAEIKAGLQSFRPVGGRMNVIATRRKVHVVDDTYNANPASMRAALGALDELTASGRRIVVLGDMRELGRQAETLHREIGGLTAQIRPARLYLAGDYAETVAAGAISEGLPTKAVFCGTHAEILADLTRRLEPGDWVLVKGSRAMGMEKIVAGLKTWGDGS